MPANTVSGHPSSPLPPDPGNFPAQAHTSTTTQAAGGAQLVPGQYRCSSEHPLGQLPQHWPEMGSLMSHPGLVSRTGAYVCKCYVTPGRVGHHQHSGHRLRLLVVASRCLLFSKQRLSFLWRAGTFHDCLPVTDARESLPAANHQWHVLQDQLVSWQG